MGRNKQLRIRIDGLQEKIRAALAETDSVLSYSSTLLDNHLDEILEAIEEVHNYAAALKLLARDDEKRDEYEARLYVALTHLEHHVKPAIKEWDRVVDRMPDD